MPADDDYGRRERLLLHQLPSVQYSQSSSASSNVPTSTGASQVVGLADYHCTRLSEGQQLQCPDQYARHDDAPSDKSDDKGSKDTFRMQLSSVHHQQYTPSKSSRSNSTNEYANSCVLVSQHGGMFSADGFPSPPSPAPANDCFVPPPPLSPNSSPSRSEKYASSQSLTGYPSTDRKASKESHSNRDRFGTAPTSPIPAANKDIRFSSAERLLVGTSFLEQKDERPQRYFASSSTERLLSAASPVLSSDRKDISRYSAISADKLLCTSPNQDKCEYERAHERYIERFLSNSPKKEHQHYSSTERILGANPDQQRYSNVETNLGLPKYSDRPSSTPVANEYQSRFSTLPDASHRYADRFNEQSLQRISSQSRQPDRFHPSERYLPSATDTRTPTSETVRYSSGSSMERLLVSVSPLPSDANRFHSLFTNSQSTGDRYATLSPTADASHHTYTTALSKSTDKHLQQLSKSVQSYGTDRYQLSSQNDQFDRNAAQDRYNDRFQQNDRYHSTDRYSPVRTTDKYLSLPKPKDRYSSGRVTSSCSSISSASSERAYGSGNSSYVPPTAHTPVERYVPQPPPEVLYPDRCTDRYVIAGAHTPTDRYVPAADPGDPYMRRDLGFHHHYRLAPPGFPYHQSHFRFRGFAYASPARISGSPGSSSSSSSTSAHRDAFSTSPLLRPKVRTSTIEFTATSSRHACGKTCCDDSATSTQRIGCCQQVRRSLPPGALSSIPIQSAHSSWQASPGSGTTASSTLSTTCTDGEGGSDKAIGMFATETAAETSPTTSATLPAGNLTARNTAGSSMNISRSLSAPAGPRPLVPTVSSATVSDVNASRPKLKRNTSRTEAIKNYIKKETATFFGVDEETEEREKQRWLDRRRRMASRKYGVLLPEHRPPDPDITKDVPDASEMPESVTLRKWQRRVRRKDSVARMTLSGLHYLAETLTRRKSKGKSDIHAESRSFPPSAISGVSRSDTGALSDSGLDEEESFFERSPSPSIPAAASLSGQAASEQSQPGGESEAPGATLELEPVVPTARETTDEAIKYLHQADDRTTIDGQVRRQRPISKDHYTLGSRLDGQRSEDKTTEGQSIGKVIAKRNIGGKRISPNTIDRVFDNSNRRQYGMGIVGRYFGRSFRKSVAQKVDVKKQLDDIEDHRPYFTYWISTVQILILIISLICYGFGPVGFNLHHRSGSVLVTSLSLQQVDFQEPANFWIGPRAADLIHLGAKFAPCMRRDIKILKEIDVWRERERDTACCIRNDDSGCVQSSKADCSNIISTWKKWGPGDSGPGGRISGSVCGLDPKFCDAPASIAPYEWPDDITKWPICRKMNPFSQRFKSKDSYLHGNANFPVGRYKDKMAEHMVCEVIGHPCCIGIHGMCRITTKEYCDFVYGYFHEDASLCSQVECLHDVCGMIPFLHPEWPDQFYRLFTTIFLHAGILHLVITLLVQYFLMRDLEKLTGSIRIAFIYFIGALAGNLASAIFVPYRAEVGPAGAHFALLATLVVEVLHCWPMLKYPRRALMKLISILGVLLLIGVLPWVDNYAHLFGFIFGFLAAYALMPFISFGHYDRRRKVFLIWVSLVLIVGLFTLLLALFYNVPMYECEVCKLFNCIPFTRDFCASQNINFNREEPV